MSYHSRRSPVSGTFLSGLVAGGLLTAAVAAAADEEPEITGEAVYQYCESCHGKRGAGGDGGKYPRIAGLPQAYIDKQLHDFKARRRVNKPMIPVFKHHRFDAEVIDLVSAHIAAMSSPDLGLWPYEPSSDALAAYASRAALADAGGAIYHDRCSQCHGADGRGNAEQGAPPLVNQYPAYLRKQIGDFATGQREHREANHCGSIGPAEAEAVILRLVELGKD
jgi:cytochrome c553